MDAGRRIALRPPPLPCSPGCVGDGAPAHVFVSPGDVLSGSGCVPAPFPSLGRRHGSIEAFSDSIFNY